MSETVTVKLVRSLIGRKPSIRRTAVGLGLTRIGRTVTLPANPSVLGAIRKIRFLVEVLDGDAGKGA